MMLRKNRRTAAIPASGFLNCDDRKRFTDLAALLVRIDKHLNARESVHCNSKTVVKKVKQKGSLKWCGPDLFLTISIIEIYFSRIYSLILNCDEGDIYEKNIAIACFDYFNQFLCHAKATI